jgi:uncharacterized protein YbjT (DUF2867 family)
VSHITAATGPLRRSVRLVAAALLGVLSAACAGGLATGTGVDPLAGKTVLVAGASGRVGHRVVQRLQEQGVAFRALTRDVQSAETRWGATLPGVRWVAGDVRDAARMREVMPGSHFVICVIGSREIAGENSAEFVDYGGVKNLVDAARASGVRQFVLLTAIGVTDKEHPFNKATRGALEWRFRGEEYLRQSGLSYTIVRPGGLVDTPAGQQGVRLAQGDDWRPVLRATLSREDLALVLIEALRTPGARNVTFEIVNDPAVAVGAWREQLKILRPD